MKHEIAVGVMTAPKIEAVIPGPHSTPDHPTFLLKNVRIGIGFHCDRLEDQEFEGTLEIRDNADGTQTAINRLDVEDYLSSVITSEMSATSSLELLKAHAVISAVGYCVLSSAHPLAQTNLISAIQTAT